MKSSARLLVMMGLLVGATQLTASGPLGIYGIVEKVVVEPNEETPERIQVWGAFAYVDGAAGLTVSAVKRGYLYFRFPTVADGVTHRSQVEVIKNEWADLKAVAGTGQAIGFGRWGYIGAFPACSRTHAATGLPTSWSIHWSINGPTCACAPRPRRRVPLRSTRPTPES